MTYLAKTAANYVALSPLCFLQRAAAVYPGRIALIDGVRQWTWVETYARCRRLASALHRLGIRRGDTVSTMLPNVAAMYEAHFGIPMAGAVLNAMNIRLNAEVIAFMLEHSQTKVVLIDPEFADVVARALSRMQATPPIVIEVAQADHQTNQTNQTNQGRLDYEQLLAEGDPAFGWQLPEDEWDAIALGYTSGTTGTPKGAISHHRGAYLNAISNVLAWELPSHCVYLWTLPMFHCNGWCFPWTLALVAGTSVCLRRIDAAAIVEQINTHRVTHYCGAPIVHSMLADAQAGIRHRVNGMIAGAAPPVQLFERMEGMGITLTHVYGLTETYGPAAVCARQPEWDTLSGSQRAECNSRQGVAYHLQQAVAVLDPLTMAAVPHDGQTIGEVMFRGNLVMQGYLKDPAATAAAFAGGWFHSGDLAVVQADGYLKIKDRSKDVIISGGENISSLEVEEVLQRHPAIQSAAVVAMADEKWGEVPAAFIELRANAPLSEAELIDFCRAHLARFKVPKKFIFGPLTRTSTGKVQKFALREQLKTTPTPASIVQ